jgi:hypothetical protein
MNLIALTGLPNLEKATLTFDLVAHFQAQGQRVTVLDNANVTHWNKGIAVETVAMRGGCACCSVAGKLYKTVEEIGADTDVVIFPADSQTHIDNLTQVLDNLIDGSRHNITVQTVALIDNRTQCCFPYVEERLVDNADVTLYAPFTSEKAINELTLLKSHDN